MFYSPRGNIKSGRKEESPPYRTFLGSEKLSNSHYPQSGLFRSKDRSWPCILTKCDISIRSTEFQNATIYGALKPWLKAIRASNFLISKDTWWTSPTRTAFVGKTRWHAATSARARAGWFGSNPWRLGS